MTLVRQFSLVLFLLGLLIAVPRSAPADALSLAGRTSILTDRAAPIQVSRPRAAPQAKIASLFIGSAEKSFFAPYPERPDRRAPGMALPAKPLATGTLATGTLATGTPAELIRHLIAAAEAGKMGYDAVNHGAKRPPARPPTTLSIAEIYAWIEATPGQPHAIGRYQFIPATLRRLVTAERIDPRAPFSPAVQDRLADVLLAEAGLEDLQSGRIGRRGFMNNLAKIWAGLPTSAGRSHYDGYAGNRATMSWARFDAEMTKIFPG